ncbi:hypothetical protein [Streptosporangium sp. NPDC006007]|uniref:hypothetical protein n=1 Tax=Streptosporangium sp. NPDC006007 TaxID=3154575 RepID=UPI0033B99098
MIKLHKARHTVALPGLEADLDVKVVSAQLGHSTTVITQNLYRHVRQAVFERRGGEDHRAPARAAEEDEESKIMTPCSQADYTVIMRAGH